MLNINEDASEIISAAQRLLEGEARQRICALSREALEQEYSLVTPRNFNHEV